MFCRKVNATLAMEMREKRTAAKQTMGVLQQKRLRAHKQGCDVTNFPFLIFLNQKWHFQIFWVLVLIEYVLYVFENLNLLCFNVILFLRYCFTFLTTPHFESRLWTVLSICHRFKTYSTDWTPDWYPGFSEDTHKPLLNKAYCVWLVNNVGWWWPTG